MAPKFSTVGVVLFAGIQIAALLFLSFKLYSCILAILIALVTVDRKRAAKYRKMISYLGSGMLFLLLVRAAPWLSPAQQTPVAELFDLAVAYTLFFTTLTFLFATSKKDDVLDLLIYLKLPGMFIFVITRSFDTINSINRIYIRVLLAQKLKGIRVKGIIDRFRSLRRSVSTITNVLFLEADESSIALTARGMFSGARITVVEKPELSIEDTILATVAILTVIAGYMSA